MVSDRSGDWTSARLCMSCSSCERLLVSDGSDSAQYEYDNSDTKVIISIMTPLIDLYSTVHVHSIYLLMLLFSYRCSFISASIQSPHLFSCKPPFHILSQLTSNPLSHSYLLFRSSQILHCYFIVGAAKLLDFGSTQAECGYLRNRFGMRR